MVSRLKPFINDPHFQEAFKELVNIKLDLIHKNMEASRPLEEMYRLQGQASVWRSLLKLRDEINGGLN